MLRPQADRRFRTRVGPQHGIAYHGRRSYRLEAVAGQLLYLVENDDTIRAATADVLAIAGYELRSFSSGSEFLSGADLSRSDGVVLDLWMPGLAGLGVLARLAELGSPLRVLMTCDAGNVPGAVAAMRAGALEVIEKPYQAGDLLKAVATLIGEVSRPEAAREANADPLAVLTPRQRQVLEALADERGNREVAEVLRLSQRTVEMHRSAAMHRLGVASFADAMLMVFDARAIGAPAAPDRAGRQAHQEQPRAHQASEA